LLSQKIVSTFVLRPKFGLRLKSQRILTSPSILLLNHSKFVFGQLNQQTELAAIF